MKRTTISLIATTVALAAVTGFAALTAPDSGSAAEAKAPARMPVERSSLLCPAPSGSELSETAYTAFTPAGKTGAAKDGAANESKAELKPSAAPLAAPDTETEPKKDGAKAPDAAKGVKKPGQDKALLALKEPGKPAAAKASGGEAPALVGTATGSLAPGWTAQQTTTVTAGGARGLLGVSCTAPDTDFWFPGASTAEARQDYVHLTNPDATPAVADIELYGKDGTLKTTLTEGIPVPAGSSVPVLLSTLTADPAGDVTVHVTTRTGRVGAVVRAADDKTGSDWLAAAADPSGTVVLPGIPADATSVQLVAFAPGDDDADLKVQLAGATGRITPAGHETLHVKSGMTAAVDLRDVTKGEAGSLILSPAQSGRATPVVAALRVVRGKGDKQEVAFIPATVPVGERATAADNRAKGSTLSLTAPGAAAQVKVIASAGTEGGTQVVRTYTVKAGTTLAVPPPPVPAGLKGSYALTVETVSGGPVHASRTLALPQDGIPMFTVQTLPDDRGTVAVPEAEQDLSVLGD
ncbi:hypothetical protein HRW16_28605 [Streptomyces lunaelactis]|uniref:DUF5719 family protein n=1 Tax=Streptomyces lunaelactis TaxID=1535768 RepID=UPI001584DE81|nr:DUF5719 family protein [Streptomyces lunaelactis]NUK38155.1 hypothetical protein [Streptomyces lunaelactis]NUK95717.1 hypothetical protein [Streptomyces lunaelactis]